MPIDPFEVRIPQAALDGLRERLAHTRWPDQLLDSGWGYGSELSYMKELVDYWQGGFDWRAQEDAINSYAHFRAGVDGLGIHFIHERGRGANPMPLIVTHGWPGSFYEMLKIIPLLTDPAGHGGDANDSFDVVVPSLPGYGFSDRPTRPGMSKSRIAEIWQQLMTEVLGYRRFGAHGGDIGAGVTTKLGLNHPARLLGIHITAVANPYLGPGTAPLTEAERDFVEFTQHWETEEGAYGHIQATRPQTLAYGLNDSPAGLAAWIVEKFRAWSDCGGQVESRFTKDELLTNITIYWVTETINSSIRLYADNRLQPPGFKEGERITVPCGIALTREKIDQVPREWAERSYNVQRWTEFPRGGHFAAMEEPELLVEDIREFFRPLRSQ